MLYAILFLLLALILIQCYRVWSLHQRAKEIREILRRLGVEDNQCGPRS